MKKTKWKKVAIVAGRIAEVGGAAVGAKSKIIGGMIEAGGKKVQEMAAEAPKGCECEEPKQICGKCGEPLSDGEELWACAGCEKLFGPCCASSAEGICGKCRDMGQENL
jgi:hypothetical protein